MKKTKRRTIAKKKLSRGAAMWKRQWTYARNEFLKLESRNKQLLENISLLETKLIKVRNLVMAAQQAVDEVQKPYFHGFIINKKAGKKWKHARKKEAVFSKTC